MWCINCLAIGPPPSTGGLLLKTAQHNNQALAINLLIQSSKAICAKVPNIIILLPSSLSSSFFSAWKPIPDNRLLSPIQFAIPSALLLIPQLNHHSSQWLAMVASQPCAFTRFHCKKPPSTHKHISLTYHVPSNEPTCWYYPTADLCAVNCVQ